MLARNKENPQLSLKPELKVVMFSPHSQASKEDQGTILKAQLKAMPEDFPQAELDLRPYKDVLTDDLLKPILINAGKYLKKLIIDDCRKLSEDASHLIAKHCPRIIHLSTKNMIWHAWSTYGVFTDSKFPELKTLCIEGCFNLSFLYIIAPNLQNVESIAKVFHTIINANPRKKDSIFIEINKKIFLKDNIQTLVMEGLAKDLKDNNITELSLKEWGDPTPFIHIIIDNIANNHSLSTLHINVKHKSLPKDIKLLSTSLMLHQPRVTLDLDLSDSGFYWVDEIYVIADILSKDSTIQKLNLSDNQLGYNEGLLRLTTALKTNQSLVELKVNGSPQNHWPYYYGSSYKNTFDDASLTPFFNVLIQHQKLQSVAIAGYFTDQTAVAVANTLKHNKTLTHLCINQHSYHCKVTPGSSTISYVHMTNMGASLIAEGIKENRTLTSLSLQNVLFRVEGYKALADALENNTTLTTFEINWLKAPIHDKCIFTSHYFNILNLNKNEIAEIQIQEKRIQVYLARNRALLVAEPRAVVDPAPSTLEEKRSVTSSFSPAFFQREEKQSSMQLSESFLPDPPASLPADAHAGTALQLNAIYYSELAKHIHRINKYLGLDEETQREEFIISKDSKLQYYYAKLCELIFYFKASQSLSTMLIAKEDNIYDMATMLAAESGKAALHFIPVVAGLSCAIKAAEVAQHSINGIVKHRKAINLVLFTHGLGLITEERLIKCFARKLTLMYQDQIRNPDKALLSQSSSTIGQILENGMQKFREFREGHTYKAQEKLALFDLFKILEAIYTEKILPPVKGTEEERFTLLLETMLEFIRHEKEKTLEINNPSACHSSFSPSKSTSF